MKNIFKIFLIFFLVNTYLFASNLVSTYYKKINNVFLNYEKELDSCKKKKQFYTNLVSKIDKVCNLKQYKKYRRLFKIIKIVAKYRLKNIRCYKKSIYLWSWDWLLYNQFDYTWLVKDIVNFSWIKLKKFFKPKIFKGIKVINTITPDFHMLIDGKWYQYNGLKVYYYNCFSKNYLKKCLKDIIKKEWKDKFFWIVYKKKIPYVYIFSANKFVTVPFDFSKPLKIQFRSLNKRWGIYIDNFLFVQRTNKNNKIYWLADIDWRLFMIVWAWPIRFYIYNPGKNNFRFPIEDSNLIVVKQTDNSYFIFTGGLSFYYIGNKKFFSNRLNFNLLGKLLFPTYLKISLLSENYNKKDIILLLNLIKKYDWKKLSNFYSHLVNTYKYNPYLYKVITNYHYNQEQLESLLMRRKELLKNWIIFDVIKNRTWVCQSFTEIVSLVAILNWVPSDVVKWYIKWNSLLHQVSKIWNLYYDPTYDLWTKNMKYFGISKEELLKYFKILKNEKVF